MLGAGRASLANALSLQRCRVPSRPLPCYRQAASPVPSLLGDINTLSLKLKAPSRCAAPNPRELGSAASHASPSSLAFLAWRGCWPGLFPLGMPGSWRAQTWATSSSNQGARGSGGRYGGGGQGCSRPFSIQVAGRVGCRSPNISCSRTAILPVTSPCIPPGWGNQEGLCHSCKQILYDAP